MDSFGVFADGEWESFNKMFSNEEFNFTQHDDQGLHYITPSTFYPISEANKSLFYSSNTNPNSNFHNLSQDSTSFGSNCSTSTAFNVPNLTHETYFFSNISNEIPLTNDVSMFMTFPDIAMEETCPIDGSESQATTAVVPANELQLIKRKFDEPELFHSTVEGDRVLNVSSIETNGKKKPRASRDVQRTNKKNVEKSKKKQYQNVCPKGNEGEESINVGSDGQSSTSTYNSEDDGASQETNNEESKASLALNLNGKPRASRGSATDPQSLYARKRRERINERLRILQNLVPNGTKVDISTMLEEAVHYVKFMQLQIKLLSSDDLWMYAPLAYNGLDLYLNQKSSSFL